MRILRVIVTAASFMAAFSLAHADNPIVLSLFLPNDFVTSTDRLTIAVTLTNASDVPRYIDRDAARALEFAVRTQDERLVHTWGDPPAPPPPIRNPFDLIWIDAGKSLQFTIRVPLESLGVRETGRYRLVGFWHGHALTERDLEAAQPAFAFTHSEPVYVSVTEER